MTASDPLRPEDRVALDSAVRRTTGRAALRRIHRLITEEQAAQRRVRKLALAGLAIFLAGFAVAAFVGGWLN
jgi:hypothetical protein